MTGIEKEPDFLDEFAGAHADKLRLFAKNLAMHGETLGLIGPLELPRLWTRHIINSALLADLLAADTTLADVGSGGGFPGIVIAALRPDVHVRLIEPMERRCKWLNTQKSQLELNNVTVLRGRAEEFHGAFEVDQVTARAVTALRKLVPITAPLVRDGGQMLFLKGSGIDNEIVAAEKALKKYKLTNTQVQVLGEGLTEPTRVFLATVR